MGEWVSECVRACVCACVRACVYVNACIDLYDKYHTYPHAWSCIMILFFICSSAHRTSFDTNSMNNYFGGLGDRVNGLLWVHERTQVIPSTVAIT